MKTVDTKHKDKKQNKILPTITNMVYSVK